MGLELKQNLKLTQQLVMTPQMQQAIKMLQMSQAELEELIQEELEKNPALEEREEPQDPAEEEMAPGRASEAADAREPSAPPEPSETPEVGGTDKSADIDWEKYFENSQTMQTAPSNREARDDDELTFDARLTRRETLFEHLMAQIGLMRLTRQEEAAAEMIAGNLDDDGYLVFDGLCGDPIIHVAAESGLPLTGAEALLQKIQRLDPVGAGARDLRECLLVQAEAEGIADCLVGDLIRGHLEDVGKHRFPAVAKKLGVSLRELDFAVRELERFEPKPGRKYSGEESRAVIPDVWIRKMGDDYVVELNSDCRELLRVSAFYKKAIREGACVGEVRDFVRERISSAAWFVRALQQRQRTIERVTESIIKYQRGFLERGVSALKPLTLRDVAEDIGMHESTISRVTTAKYVHTPQGVYELKFFFNAAIPKAGGEEIANEAVRSHIQRIIKSENPKKPYSDQQIVALLHTEGIEVARRTVTKYREQLRIPSSSKRRKFV